MRPLFSIITICYNASDSISRTMESVLNQSFYNYEYIIVDGASNDNTYTIVKGYNDARLITISEPDKGISDAFNKAISLSNGEYLLFLNSGDYFLNHHILKDIEPFIHTDPTEIITFSVSSISKAAFPENLKEGLAGWKIGMIPHQGTFVHRNVFKKVGWYHTEFKIRMDYDFFSRCRYNQCSFKCIPKLIVHYDTSGVSDSNIYLFHKEGLAVRLLYQNSVQKSEMDVLKYLLEDEYKDDGEMSDYIQEAQKQRKQAKKYQKLFQLMSTWLQYYKAGNSIVEFFLKNHYMKIAIYGYGLIGKNIEAELENSKIVISYIIDQNQSQVFPERKLVGWEDEWDEVDLIVVTPIYEYQMLKNKIQKKCAYKILSIEDILSLG